MKLNSSLTTRESINDWAGRMTLGLFGLLFIQCQIDKAEGVWLKTVFSFFLVFYPGTELPQSRQNPTRRTSPPERRGFGTAQGAKPAATAAASATAAAATKNRPPDPGSTVPPWCRSAASSTPARWVPFCHAAGLPLTVPRWDGSAPGLWN